MRVWVFHRYPIPQAVETNASLLDFLHELAKRGCEVHYISMKSSPEQQFHSRDFALYELPFTIQRKNASLKIAQSLFYYLASVLYAIPLNLEHNRDLVYCDDSFPFLGLFLKVFGRTKVVIRLGDLQTANFFGRNADGHLFRFLHWFEVAYWRMVDGVIPISKAFLDYAASKGVGIERMRTVPECVDSDFFRPSPADSNMIPKRENIRFMYHGILEPEKGLGTPLEHFERYISEGGRAEFVIVGEGSVKSKLMNRFSQLVSSGHLIFLGWKNLSELPAIINTTDAGLVSRRPCLANDFVATAGMLQYLACGKPVIAPDLRTVADVVSRGRCGILFRYWSQHDFAEAIELLKSNPLMRADLGRNAREAVVKEYSKHVVSKQLADAIIDLHRFAESK